MKFPVSTIPTFINVSKFIVHTVIIIIIIIIFRLFGYITDIYLLQIPVYMLLSFVFLNIWSLFSSMLGAISKDYINLIKSFITALFWLSGILWEVDNVKIIWLKRLLALNPITFLTNGFRNAFINKIWFWEQPKRLEYFIIECILLLIIGLKVYKKLRKEIPDVL